MHGLGAQDTVCLLCENCCPVAQQTNGGERVHVVIIASRSQLDGIHEVDDAMLVGGLDIVSTEGPPRGGCLAFGGKITFALVEAHACLGIIERIQVKILHCYHRPVERVTPHRALRYSC